MSNDSEEVGRGKTDWRTLLTAVGVFYASLTGLGWLHTEYLLGRVDQRITAHASDAEGKRATFFGKLESAANAAVVRVGELERNCAVVQSRMGSVEARLDGLDHWRSECSQKMAGVRQYIDRDAVDIQKLEDRVERLEDALNPRRK